MKLRNRFWPPEYSISHLNETKGLGMNARLSNPSILDYLFAAAQYALPQQALSSLMFRLTRSRIGPWKQGLIHWFTRHYQVDLSLAEPSEPEAYPDFNAFFTRALRPGTRPIASSPEVIVSPIDGTVSAAGTIHASLMFQAKGKQFDLVRLLGGNPTHAEAFQDGRFVTLYLSPQDYHRVHMPAGGQLLGWSYLPGRLFSVNPSTTRTVPGLFARNERVVSFWKSEHGPMALILVGAIFVGSIELVWAGQVTPPHGQAPKFWEFSVSEKKQPPVELHRGAEMGRFNMGSTVIVLLGPDQIHWAPELLPGTRVKVGQPIGHRRCPAQA